MMVMVMVMVMMSVVNDYDLFRVGAMPAGLAFARLCERADTVGAAADLSARLTARRFVLDFATRWQAPFRLRSWPGL
jgi:hypothetical protein